MTYGACMLQKQNILSRQVPLATFDEVLLSTHCEPLIHERTTTLQLNVGNKCNQDCAHCHVNGAPGNSEEMPSEVVDRVFELVEASKGVTTIDITGGAPELNPNFRKIVSGASRLGRQVIVRSNLTVLIDGGLGDLPSFLKEHHATICASLPCYLGSNVDAQRGTGVFEKSIRALRLLNDVGYGMPGSNLWLNLVHNPVGPFLPAAQQTLEASYRQHLRTTSHVEFNRLLTIANMPAGRFARSLRLSGRGDVYMQLLVDNFNRKNVTDVMCRTLVSVKWDGTLYDCDFNQALQMSRSDALDSIWKISSFDEWEGRRILTGHHCFGCTAGAGSSCGGSLQVKSC